MQASALPIGAWGPVLKSETAARKTSRRFDRSRLIWCLELLRLNVRRLGPLASFTGFEGDLLTFTQRLETLTGNV